MGDVVRLDNAQLQRIEKVVSQISTSIEDLKATIESSNKALLRLNNGRMIEMVKTSEGYYEVEGYADGSS